MELALTKGYVATVDDDDPMHPWRFKWTAQEQRHRGLLIKVYAYRMSIVEGKQVKQYLHQFLLQCKGVDHKDGDGLNNRRRNLRPATRSQNMRNQNLSIRNTSGYKGVSWNKNRSKWNSYISVNDKKIHLGVFANSVSAAQAYDEAALKYHGKFAVTNAMLRLI